MRFLAALAITLTLLLAGLQSQLWFGTGGRPAVADLHMEVLAQTWHNGELRQRNAALVAEVNDLKTGDMAIEDRARTEFGMIKPDEVFYRVVDKDGVLDADPGDTP